MKSIAPLHGPAGSSVVSVRSTVPATISFGPGEYDAFNAAALSNVPSPEVDHVLAEADPPRAPGRTAEVPAQMFRSPPAPAVAAGESVITVMALAATQGPGGSLLVKVSIALPLLTSAAPGV